MKTLSRRQREVLEFVTRCIRERGVVPSVREVAEHLGLRSSATAQRHLRALVEKGYLRRIPRRMRGLELVHPGGVREVVHLPLLGRVAAGRGAVAEEVVEEFLPVPRHLGWQEGCFLLRVRGDSMVGAGIFEGDLVVVRRQQTALPGDLVVALVGEEATVKRLGNEAGQFVLYAENPAYPPIREAFQIVGKVVGLLRRYPEVRS
ncbi:MAG: transcriptional repressor LexA [Armatimonadota bacterium]|nr:transcriptional repressor LexA [Armatimonadota bacterium]MDR7444399.1 transcriptional repressor LexA [Armatimonadota bacterium]MDR7570755.1 transcriptional repressor LexA [Armatimonadota bacterium]MDR7614885.1 transcriptional repressor LexA [Armatimonadota bacterium]